MITQKQKYQIECKAKETLKANLSKITYKYKNLKETNNYILEKKQILKNAQSTKSNSNL